MTNGENRDKIGVGVNAKYVWQKEEYHDCYDDTTD